MEDMVINFFFLVILRINFFSKLENKIKIKIKITLLIIFNHF
jgi:hypothetical protein